MVAAISTTHKTSKNPSTPQNPIRAPLSPSGKTNNADSISRKTPTKPINSRYLHFSSSSSSSPSSSSSIHHSQVTTTRSLSVSFQGESFSFQTTKPKPISQNPPKRPTTKTQKLNCPSEKKGQVLAAITVVGHSMVFYDKVKRANFDGDDLYLTTDSECSSPGSNLKGRVVTRGVSVPARFWPENYSPVKKSALMDTQLSSPSKVSGSSVKRMDSHWNGGGNPHSILCFRVKKGESRLEEAHSYRLLYDRYLQWRFVNAQAEAKITAQRVNLEKKLYDAWMTISVLRDSITNEQMKLQLLLQNLKLASILDRQMTRVEEWSLIDSEHCNYLSGLIEALKSSTFRLPVVSGARVDIHDLQNTVGSAVDAMLATETSMYSLHSRVEWTRSLMSELTKAAAHERALLEQLKDLVSVVTALHAKQCSLQGHIIQLSCHRDTVQL